MLKRWIHRTANRAWCTKPVVRGGTLRRSRTPLLVLAVAVFLPVPAPSSVNLAEESEGFLGFRWGTPLSEIAGRLELQPQMEEGPYAVYDCPLASFEHIDVSSCGLEFVGGKLAGAFCMTIGPENSSRMASYLVGRFGAGHREHRKALQWFGKETHAAYDEDEAGNAYIYCYSRKLIGPPR